MKQYIKQRAAGLLEVMIALFVIATGVVVLMKFQAELLQHRGYVQQQSEALQIAENKLDDLRHYSVIDTTSGSKAYQDIASGSSTVSGQSATYAVAWTVTEYTSPDYKNVSITVSWTDASNTNRSVSLNGIVAKVDPANSGTIMQGL